MQLLQNTQQPTANSISATRVRALPLRTQIPLCSQLLSKAYSQCPLFSEGEHSIGKLGYSIITVLFFNSEVKKKCKEMHRAMTTEFKTCWKGENKEEIECMQGGASGGEIRHRHFFHFLSFFLILTHSFMAIYYGLITWTPR